MRKGKGGYDEREITKNVKAPGQKKKKKKRWTGGERIVIRHVGRELGWMVPKLGLNSPLPKINLRKHGKSTFGIGNVRGGGHAERAAR